ncbi:MAG: alpha/beta fold hydrolase [Streptosporangiales bacterium]|nr:alpha/beta fold hydrolase [Streptosporangiales bacterium]
MDTFSNGPLSFEVTDTPASGAGNGETVILLHGFPEDRHSWDSVTPALADAGYRVLAPNQRGYTPGARPAAREAYTLNRLGGDVLSLAKAAGADQFHLVGHDWGAALAWYLAGRHPKRLLSLTALSVPHSAAFMKSFTAGPQALKSWYMGAFQVPWLPERLLSRDGGSPMRDMLVRTGLDSASADRYAARAADPDAMTGPLNWYRALPLNLSDQPAGVEVPSLYIWGDRDPFISRAAAQLCSRYVTGGYRFEALPGASHWLPQEKPAEISSLLVEHFRKSPRSPRP